MIKANRPASNDDEERDREDEYYKELDAVAQAEREHREDIDEKD